MDEDIFVTKSFLPSFEEYSEIIKRIWDTNQLTNSGPLAREFEVSVADYLGVGAAGFNFVTNGTLALQLALRALDIEPGEVITTPFTYVATTSAIMWEHHKPRYVDIDPRTFNIDPSKIEQAITGKTRAILAVHVFGNPCDVDTIQRIADKYRLKVIYDAAHAFGVNYQGKSILEYGDVSTLSFHATKLFHTIEGGGVYTDNTELASRIERLKRFGHDGDNHYHLGINAKANEFQAAMGLCNLKHIDEILAERKRINDLYDQRLSGFVRRPVVRRGATLNYNYYPVLFSSQSQLQKVRTELEANRVFSRRYFYPSLTELPYVDSSDADCPTSKGISERVLCLPLYHGLKDETAQKIADLVVDAITR